MNQEYISSLQKKLKNRVHSLCEADYFMFEHALRQFWMFINKTPIFVNLLISLNCSDKDNNYKNKINKFHTNLLMYERCNPGEKFNLYEISQYDENKYSLLCYLIICKCCESNENHENKPATMGKIINSRCNDNKKGLIKFKQEIIKPLCQYIDERLDEQKLTIELIRRYKQKSEWFKRKKLYDIWQENTSKGEKLLALDLYEYLFDCGLDFNIEPWSINGEPDLVSAQKEAPLIADTKIFNGNKIYIIKGFNQVYTYTLTYNQPFGYLIIYKVCEKDLRFSLHNQTRFTQFISCNNKTIFITVIDIYNYKDTASQRKPIKPIEITEQELIDGLKSNRSTEI